MTGVPKPIEDETVLFWAREYECVAGPLPMSVEFRTLVHERDRLKAELEVLRGPCNHTWVEAGKENDYIIERCSSCGRQRRFV